MRRLGLKIFGALALVAGGHYLGYRIVHVPSQLELMIVVSAALFYPVIRKPVIGLYAIFLLLPMIPFIRRLYYLQYDRPDLDPLIALGDVILVFILAGLFFTIRERRDIDRDVAPQSALVLGYFLFMLARVFVFNTQPLTQSLAKFKFYGPPALFFFVGVVYAFSFSHLRRFWQITIGMGIVAAVYGYKQLYFGYSEAEKLWFASVKFSTLFIGDIARPFSFFQAPVAFADYMQLSIIGILIFFELKWSGRILLSLLPLLFYAVLITSVRSSWIGVIATFVIWMVLFRIKGNKRRIGAIAGFALAFILSEIISDLAGSGIGINALVSFIASAMPQQQYVDLLVTNRATAIYDPLGEHSLLSRFMLWKYLLTSSAQPIKAIMGRGLGALKADSLYFTYLAEFGYPGLLCILALFGVFIRNGLRLIDTSKSKTAVALAKGITAMNIVFALVSVTGTHIHYFPGDVYFWFWNGVLAKLTAQIDISDAQAYENLADA
jgi:O-antigen ligase